MNKDKDRTLVIVIRPTSITHRFQHFGLDEISDNDLRIIARTLTDVVISRQKSDQPSQDDPIAKTFGDLITPKQLVEVRSIANKNGVNAREECQRLFKCNPEELNKSAASGFIDHLNGLA